jgi:hypothetical protein
LQDRMPAISARSGSPLRKKDLHGNPVGCSCLTLPDPLASRNDAYSSNENQNRLLQAWAMHSNEQCTGKSLRRRLMKLLAGALLHTRRLGLASLTAVHVSCLTIPSQHLSPISTHALSERLATQVHGTSTPSIHQASSYRLPGWARVTQNNGASRLSALFVSENMVR